MPSEGQVAQLRDRRIKSPHLAESNDTGVALIGIIRTEELPGLVTEIMGDVKDRPAIEHDAAQ